MILSIFLAVLAGAVIAAVIYLGVLGIQKLVSMIGEKLNNNKNHRVHFFDAQDIAEKLMESKENAKVYSETELSNALNKTSHIMVVADKETDEIKEVEYLKVDKLDDDLKNWLDTENSWIVMDLEE